MAQVVGDIAAEHRGGQFAVIAPSRHLASLRGCAPAVLTPGEAKGLEFDAVLIVDPDRVLGAPLGRNDLYVAMTRATRRLGIVHFGPPPAGMARIRERGRPPVRTPGPRRVL